MRHKKVEKREPEADKMYQNVLVAKFINRMMYSGKKTIAEGVVYGAFDIIKTKHNQDPLEVFEKALQNVGPKIEVKARRIGGANYQVPSEVRGERRVSLAIRWIITAAQGRANKEFHTTAEKLAVELMEASQNLGSAVKKRDTVLKTAEANRAFSHFRF